MAAHRRIHRLDQANHTWPQGSVLGVGRLLGMKNVRTDEPRAPVVSKILESLVPPQSRPGFALGDAGGFRMHRQEGRGTHNMPIFSHTGIDVVATYDIIWAYDKRSLFRNRWLPQ